MVEGRRSAAGVLAALTPLVLPLQALNPQLKVLVALLEVWGQNRRVNQARLDAWIGWECYVREESTTRNTVMLTFAKRYPIVAHAHLERSRADHSNRTHLSIEK